VFISGIRFVSQRPSSVAKGLKRPGRAPRVSGFENWLRPFVLYGLCPLQEDRVRPFLFGWSPPPPGSIADSRSAADESDGEVVEEEGDIVRGSCERADVPHKVGPRSGGGARVTGGCQPNEWGQRSLAPVFGAGFAAYPAKRPSAGSGVPLCGSGSESGTASGSPLHRNFSTIISSLCPLPLSDAEYRSHRLSGETERPHATHPSTFATVSTFRVAKWKQRTEGFLQPEK